MTTETTLNMPAFIASDTYGPVLLRKPKDAESSSNVGTLVGRVTNTGLLKDYDPLASDGCENPVAILLEASADNMPLYGFAGVYVKDSILGLDDAAILALEPRGIYFT